MKREELKAKLGNIDNVKSIIDYIMAENGKDIAEAKKLNADLQANFNQTKADYEKQVKELQDKLGLYNDAEIEELRTYKKNSEEEKINNRKQEAILKLIRDNKFDAKAERLLAKAVEEYKPEFADDYSITNADDISTALKTDYAPFITTTSIDGANPARSNDRQESTDPFIQGFYKKDSK